QDILGLDVVGVIPESPEVLDSSNAGVPVILDEVAPAGQAYQDAVARILGEDRPLRLTTIEKRGFLSKMFGGGAMGNLDILAQQNRNSASVAKNRLQILIQQERRMRNAPDYLPVLQRELLEVIRRYINVDAEAVKVDLHRDGDSELLDISVQLPEKPAAANG